MCSLLSSLPPSPSTLPSLSLPSSSPQPGSPVIRILHLSDIHVDLAYTPGLTNDCGEPLCCRVPNPPGKYATNQSHHFRQCPVSHLFLGHTEEWRGGKGNKEVVSNELGGKWEGREGGSGDRRVFVCVWGGVVDS